MMINPEIWGNMRPSLVRENEIFFDPNVLKGATKHGQIANQFVNRQHSPLAAGPRRAKLLFLHLPQRWRWFKCEARSRKGYLNLKIDQHGIFQIQLMWSRIRLFRSMAPWLLISYGGKRMRTHAPTRSCQLYVISLGINPSCLLVNYPTITSQQILIDRAISCVNMCIVRIQLHIYILYTDTLFHVSVIAIICM